MSDLPAIATGRTVSLHLEVRFQDGCVALSSFGEEPIRCTIGDGTLAPGVEALLSGLAAGADETIMSDGSEVFGPYDPGNLHWMQLAEFPEDLDPAPGQVVAFATPGGHETSGVIREREEDRVQVDFNHPFAGRALTLRAKVLSVA